MELGKAPLKEWYKSKIVLFALAIIAIAIGTHLNANQVTPEQMRVLQTALPDIAEAVKKYQAENNLFSLIGSVTAAIIAVFRVWFTTSIIPQSLPTTQE